MVFEPVEKELSDASFIKYMKDIKRQHGAEIERTSHEIDSIRKTLSDQLKESKQPKMDEIIASHQDQENFVPVNIDA